MNGWIPASHVLRYAAALMGRPWTATSSPDPETFGQVRSCMDQRLAEAWTAAAWPELRSEGWRRRLVESYDATKEYVRDSEVLWLPANYCYQAVQGVPAGIEPSNGAYWALLKADYGAPWWDGKVAYQATQQVTDPATEWSYQALISVPAGVPLSNGAYWKPLHVWRPEFSLVETPPMGLVRAVSSKDPHTCTDCPCELDYEINSEGVRVLGDPGRAYFVWMKPRPLLIGEPWREDVAYTADAQVWLERPTSLLGNEPIGPTFGDFYNALDDVAAGEGPLESPGAWERVNVPERLSGWVALFTAADWLRLDGQVDKAGDLEKRGVQERERVLFQFQVKEHQRGQLPVPVRG